MKVPFGRFIPKANRQEKARVLVYQGLGLHKCGGEIGISRGLTTNNELEATMKQTMIEQAQQVIVVCESRKIGSDNFHHVLVQSERRP